MFVPRQRCSNNNYVSSSSVVGHMFDPCNHMLQSSALSLGHGSSVIAVWNLLVCHNYTTEFWTRLLSHNNNVFYCSTTCYTCWLRGSNLDRRETEMQRQILWMFLSDHHHRCIFAVVFMVWTINSCGPDVVQRLTAMFPDVVKMRMGRMWGI